MKLLRSVLSGSALALFASCFWLTASAVHVKSYTKKDGTYVAPHERTSPNHTKNDNYSTKGNVNPYTGKAGTKPGDSGPVATTTAPIAETPDEERVAITIPPSATPSVAQTRAIVPLPPGTITDLKGGMTQAEIFQVLGAPSVVEGKSNYEVWTYPTGTVYFSPKSGAIAWKENKRTTTTSVRTKPQNQTP